MLTHFYYGILRSASFELELLELFILIYHYVNILDTSGFWGPWTYAESTFSNEYFRLLFEEEWTEKKTHKVCWIVFMILDLDALGYRKHFDFVLKRRIPPIKPLLREEVPPLLTAAPPSSIVKGLLSVTQ